MQVENTQHHQTAGFRLSPQQEHLWLLGPDAPASRAQCALLVESVDAAALRSSLRSVVQRHEALRTTFAHQSGLRFPSQVVHDALEPSWEDRTADDDTLLREPEALDELLTTEACVPLDLERGPLVRAVLIALTDDRSLLVLTASALCADTASLLIIARELAVTAAGRADSLEEPLQYADFAEWRNEVYSGDDDEANAGRAFWKEQDAAAATSPTLLFGSAVAGHAELSPSRVPLRVDPNVIAAVERAASDFGASTALFLEACWHTLVARLTGETDLAISGVVDDRLHEELRGAVGAFEQSVPLRSRFEEETSFAEVLDQVQRSRGEAERRQDFLSSADMTGLSERLALSFCAVGDALESAPGLPLLTVEALSGQFGACALQMRWRRSVDGWMGELQYDPAAYSRRDAESIATCFRELVVGAVNDPSGSVSGLRLMTDEQRARVVTDSNATSAPLPETCIQYMFEEQVRRTPERHAVSDEAGALTYAELNGLANQIARVLREQGAGRDVAVGLCMDRSTDMIVALLGILKAGAAYVPLNFEHPGARLAHQLRESGAPVLISQERLLDRLPTFDGKILCLDRDCTVLEAHPSSDPERVNEPSDRVYVMYTSGSTGLPKGVEVTHRNLVNYTIDIVGRLGIDETGDGLRFGVVSAISTDLGNTCVFPALVSGGCLHLVNPETSMDGGRFAGEVERRPLDVLKITPSHLRALLTTSGGRSILPRRWLIVGGEAMSWELPEDVARSGSCRVLNHYGPTETTVGSCTFDVGTDVEWRPETVPVGRPISNTCVYVLDSHLEPVPTGVAGELCIGGTGVSRGYVSQSEQTAQVFVPDPFSGDRDGRLYRTGDRARFLADGNIEFLGRIDSQVKIRGYRVEPSEIELALARHPAVRQAAVVAREDARGDLWLVAYLVAAPEPNAEELQAFLKETLPDFMVPSTFVTLEALPFTPGGKVDRRALPDPASLHSQNREHVAPRTPLEEALAEIWAEVLGVERVGATDDFFALGGHSLLATQVVARVRSEYADIPLHSIFTAPTVERLAEVVLEAELDQIDESDVLALDSAAGDESQ